MSLAATLLGELLNTKADINYYTQQQIKWSALYEANAAKLAKQQGYEEKFYDEVEKALGNTKELQKGGVLVNVDNQNRDLAEAYAHKVIQKYDAAYSEELAELDIEYDEMQTMLEAMLTTTRTKEESLKTAAQKAAGDNDSLGN